MIDHLQVRELLVEHRNIVDVLHNIIIRVTNVIMRLSVHHHDGVFVREIALEFLRLDIAVSSEVIADYLDVNFQHEGR